MNTTPSNHHSDDEPILEQNLGRLIASVAPRPGVAEMSLLFPMLAEVRREARRMAQRRLLAAGIVSLALTAVVAAVVILAGRPSPPPQARPPVSRGSGAATTASKEHPSPAQAQPSVAPGAPMPPAAVTPATPSVAASQPRKRGETAPGSDSASAAGPGRSETWSGTGSSSAIGPDAEFGPGAGLGLEPPHEREPTPEVGRQTPPISGPVAMNPRPLPKGPLAADQDAAWVFYLATGGEASPGSVYQVNDSGRVLGKIDLPHPAASIALRRNRGLVLAVPRGGSILEIDDAGRLATILEKDRLLPHPVGVGLAGDSDTIVVADNIMDLLAETTAGGPPKVLRRFENWGRGTPDMAVAVTRDKQVIFSSSAEPGVFRYAADQLSAKNRPILPESGGVAADPKSPRWAAGQLPNLVSIYEGPKLLTKLRLPPGKTLYRRGLMSFVPPDSLCLACTDDDKPADGVLLLLYDIRKDEIRPLFSWNKGPLTGFTAGPRMYWDRTSPSRAKSTY